MPIGKSLVCHKAFQACPVAGRGDFEAADALGDVSDIFSRGTVGNEFVLKPPDALLSKGV